MFVSCFSWYTRKPLLNVEKEYIYNLFILRVKCKFKTTANIVQSYVLIRHRKVCIKKMCLDT